MRPQRAGGILAVLLVGTWLPASAAAQTRIEDDVRSAEASALDAQRALDEFLRGQQILFKAGELELEGSTLYSTDSEDNVRVGNIVIPENTTRRFETSLLARYALTDDLEVNLAAPLVYAESDPDFTLLDGFAMGAEETDDFGLGDVRVGLRYQLLRERGYQPAVAVAVDAKSETGDELLGTENWGLTARTTVVKTLDPVVFFGGVGYTAMLEQDGLDRGDEFSAQFGTGFSVNDRVSYNLQLIGRAIGRTELDGNKLAGTSQEVISLQFGVTTLVKRNLYLEPFVNIGVTDDAPDVVVGINVPYRFDRRFIVGNGNGTGRTTNWLAESEPLSDLERPQPDSTGTTGMRANTPEYSQSVNQGWAVQIGAYRKVDNATRISSRLRDKGFVPSTTETTLKNGDGSALVVWVGPFATQSGAERIQLQIEQAIGETGLVTCRHCQKG